VTWWSIGLDIRLQRFLVQLLAVSISRNESGQVVHSSHRHMYLCHQAKQWWCTVSGKVVKDLAQAEITGNLPSKVSVISPKFAQVTNMLRHISIKEKCLQSIPERGQWQECWPQIAWQSEQKTCALYNLFSCDYASLKNNG